MNKEDILTIREFALQHVPAGFTTSPYRLSLGLDLFICKTANDRIASREEWQPKELPAATIAGQFAHQIVLLTYEHPEGLHLPGRYDGTWTDAHYADAQHRLDLALALQKDTETRLLTLMTRLCKLLERPSPPWLGELIVISDAPSALPPSAQAPSKSTSRVYWRSVLSEHYPRMCEKYGAKPSIAQALSYLKELNDSRITVRPSGEKAITWETDDRSKVEVKRDTVSNALSRLAHRTKK